MVKVKLKPREQRFIKIEAPYIDVISGLVMVRMLDKKVQSTSMLKIKLVRNSATFDVTNISSERVQVVPT